MHITIVGASANSTTLNTTETDGPWRNEYQLGFGVDAVTGQLRAPAVKPFRLVDNSPLLDSNHYSLVKDERDLSKLISRSAEGSYNLDGVNVTAGTSFLNSVKVNALSVTLVAQVLVQRTQPALSPTPYELAVEPGPNFRNSYGDYFVAGYRAASSLYVVYQCSFRSAEECSMFTATLAAKVLEVLTTEGSTEFEKAARSANATVNIDIIAQGVDSAIPSPPSGEGWSPAQVPKTVLPWFNKHQRPDPFEAYLMHYRLIDPKISGVVPIAPDTFADLARLYDSFWLCRVLFQTCPAFGRAEVEQGYKRLKAAVESQQATLAEDPAKIAELSGQCADILGALRLVNNRAEFRRQLPAAAATEPAQGRRIPTNEGRVRWYYGYSQSPLPGVDITSISQSVQQGGRIGRREHMFTYSDATRLLVGFDVICNWTDGTGGEWRKDCPEVIGGYQAAVHVKSEYDRGYNWTVIWYVVDASLYPPVM